jgi:hypothetical protein
MAASRLTPSSLCRVRRAASSFARARTEKMPSHLNNNSNNSLQAWVRALEITASISTNSSVTLPSLMDELADKFGMAFAFLAHGEPVTYRAFAERCNRYARWALGQGLVAGDVVCLLMLNNSPHRRYRFAGQHQPRREPACAFHQHCFAQTRHRRR